MKKLLSIFILFFLPMLASATTVSDVKNSGCLDTTRGDGSESLPTIVLTKEGSVLSVQLLNYESNCGTTDFNVTSAVSGGSDSEPCSVNISVFPVVPAEMDCICPYNVSFTVRDVEVNSFYLSCWWYKGQVELTEGEPMVLEHKVENVTIDDNNFKLLKVMHKALLMRWTTTEEELHIPSEVNYEGETYIVMGIDKDAFWNVDHATKVTIPKTVRSMDLDYDYAIYANPFHECKSLEWIEVEDGCPLFSSDDGVLFAENKTMLLGYPIASQRETYTVPEGVTHIRSGAFHHNMYLRKLVIPEGVTDLGWHLFSDAQSLEEIYIRGVIESGCMRDLFGGMDTKVDVYVLPSEVEKFKAFYKGSVYPLPKGDTDDSDYVPFVKENGWKSWHVIRSNAESGCHHDEYRLVREKVEKAGKTYVRMNRIEDYLTKINDFGLLREEERKVYIFDSDMQEEHLMFDYSLKAGDTYETYSYDEQKEVTYKVLSVSDYLEGPEAFRYDYDEEADSMIIRHRYLKKWTVCRTDNESLQKIWIEGVGSLEGPLANLRDVVLPSTCWNYLAYVENYDDNYTYLPFSFCDTWNSQVHGCNLPTGAESKEKDEWGRHHLTYELEGDRLHIFGEVFTQCGPNNYAYFYERKTDDPLVHKIEFKIQEVEPLADCMALHQTDFYVPGFDPNLSYIVVDNHGEEHPVINKAPQIAYRPFVEEGKVWKVGAITSGNPVQLVEYYYFDGDTLIDGKTCKQMMHQQYVNPDYAESNYISQEHSQGYVGAWYEEDKKVYYYNATDKQFKLMYDFSANANDTLLIFNQRYIIGPKQTGGIEGFKGVYRYIANHMAYYTIWLEGVGGIDGPTINVYYGHGQEQEQEDAAWFLMSCTVGDEVIYLNDDYEDGATPEEMNARKRIDFTHTIKIKPRTRMRSGEELSLYGEYNDLRLGINLDPLDAAYLVRITDETGKVVYEKSINAGSIVGLNIDISAFAKGRYTVIVENSDESFTGEFDAQATGIEEVRNKRSEVRSMIFNLQGQRLHSLQKGLNIVNGQKVFVPF